MYSNLTICSLTNSFLEMLPNSVGEPWLYYIYCYFLVFDQDCTQHISSENACLLISCKIKCINLVMLKKHQTLDFFGNFYMKRTKIQLSELCTVSEASVCVRVCVCVGMCLHVLWLCPDSPAFQKVPCLILTHLHSHHRHHSHPGLQKMMKSSLSGFVIC